MLLHLPVHCCADRDCPSYGQPTGKSCRCHKTTEELLRLQRDKAVLACLDFLKVYDGEDEPSTSRLMDAVHRLRVAVVL